MKFTFRSLISIAPILFLLLLCPLFYQCSTKSSTESKATEAVEQEDTLKQYLNVNYARAESTPSDTSTFYLINSESAVYVEPDTTWFAEQRNKMTEEDWNTVVDDVMFYHFVARDTLEKLHIPVYNDMLDKRYLKFLKKDGSTFVVDRTKFKEDDWSFLFFNGTDNPSIWNGIMMDEVLKEVYHR